MTENPLVSRLRDQAFDRYAPKDMLREAADTIERLERENARFREVVAYFVGRERSIKIDIGSAHKARGAGASDFMREDDADFRRELEAAFDKARASLHPSEEGK